MSDPLPSLAQQAIERLRAYAQGNGIAPEAIALVKANEAVYDLEGRVRLTPDCKVENKPSFGRPKNAKGQVFPSFQAMREEIDRRKAEIEKSADWLDLAAKELKQARGHGWGQQDAWLYWSDKESFLTATENCSSCRGAGKSPCQNCEGTGTTLCLYCNGTGQETCLHCAGHGVDPSNPKIPCTVCNGKRFTLCRFCQGTGRSPCEQCHGKGARPCPDCKGTGALTQEVKMTTGARLNFTLGSTAGLPSGLLRTLDRLGEAKLPQHAEIALLPLLKDPEKPEDLSSLPLVAHVPYADAKITIEGKESVISIFGKQARLSGVPPFLDKACAHALKILGQAAQGRAPLEKAMDLRLLREARDLALRGKANPDELRRLYAVGLSGSAAQTIMEGLTLALKTMTQKARAWAGALCVLASVILFAPLLLSGALADFTHEMAPALAHLIEILLPLLAMGASWQIVAQASRSALKRKYPSARLASGQTIGKTGLLAVGAIGLLYVLLFFLAASPFWAHVAGG